MNIYKYYMHLYILRYANDNIMRSQLFVDKCFSTLKKRNMDNIFHIYRSLHFIFHTPICVCFSLAARAFLFTDELLHDV